MEIGEYENRESAIHTQTPLSVCTCAGTGVALITGGGGGGGAT